MGHVGWGHEYLVETLVVIGHLVGLLMGVLWELFVELVDLRFAFEHLDLVPGPGRDEASLLITNSENFLADL